MMKSGISGGNAGNKQNAVASHTATGAETSFTDVSATLAGGATGRPVKLKASGSVGGLVQLNIGAQATYTLAVAPNQLPVEYVIPASAFPNLVNSVSIGFEAFGAGTLVGIVEFNTS